MVVVMAEWSVGVRDAENPVLVRASFVYEHPLRAGTSNSITAQHATPPLNCTAPACAVLASLLTMDPQDAVLSQNQPSLAPTPPMFTASWSPSKAKAAVLDTASLPITKRPRAWERAPQSPQAEHSRVKKVWKRYALRSQLEEPMPESGAQQVAQENEEEGADKPGVGKRSPVKIVKRLRVKSPRKAGGVALEEIEDDEAGKNYRSTRWDRRSSGLGRRFSQFCGLEYCERRVLIGFYRQEQV
jgi:hypothetical protein